MTKADGVFRAFLIACGMLLLTACNGPQPETYPISGEPCAEDDPVGEIEAGTCVPPV